MSVPARYGPAATAPLEWAASRDSRAPVVSGLALVRSAVSREDGEAAALQGSHRPKGAVVEGQDPSSAVAPCQHHQRCVRKTDAKTAMTFDHLPGRSQLGSGETFEGEGALGEIREKVQFDVYAQPVKNEIVGLCSSELAGDKRARLGPQTRDDSAVVGIGCIGLSEQRPCVDDEGHPRPRVFSYTSSDVQ